MEITAILERFYLDELDSKYAKSILVYTENMLNEYEGNTPRVFGLIQYIEYADRHKKRRSR
jgi:hypothetical protein